MPVFRIAFTGDFLNAAGQCAYTTEGLDRLDRAAHVQYHYIENQRPRDDPDYWRRFYSLEVSADDIADVDGLVVLRPWVKADTFARGADTLLVIGRSGAGYDKIDLNSCTRHGVAVFNVPKALDHSTASTALMFMLALAKRLPDQERVARTGRWNRQAEVLGSEIERRTLGIVGLGRSGRELVRLAAPFAMNFLAYSPHADRQEARAIGVELTSLEDLMRRADFISVHARLTASNHRLIGRDQFALMKRTAYLVNVARGELIDQAALVKALQERRIAGAALDVYEVEPPPLDDPLLTLDNVILTPHWSCSTIDVWQATGRAIADGMLRAAQGEVPANVVNPEVLERRSFRDKLARFEENRSACQ
ncbi:MAG: NAD(P)-dependent oxidoreductase [Planctomycetaceae bacterium]